MKSNTKNYLSSSVLETERTLVLAEKGSEDSEVELLTAGEKFRILATMNPGGDFGKKEVTCGAVLCMLTPESVPLCSVGT